VLVRFRRRCLQICLSFLSSLRKASPSSLAHRIAFLFRLQSRGECDIEETCTGNNSTCPEDKTENDGKSCGSSGGLSCASGVCTSRDRTSISLSVFPSHSSLSPSELLKAHRSLPFPSSSPMPNRRRLSRNHLRLPELHLKLLLYHLPKPSAAQLMLDPAVLLRQGNELRPRWKVR
jgi:hypothetical protein